MPACMTPRTAPVLYIDSFLIPECICCPGSVADGLVCYHSEQNGIYLGGLENPLLQDGSRNGDKAGQQPQAPAPRPYRNQRQRQNDDILAPQWRVRTRADRTGSRRCGGWAGTRAMVSFELGRAQWCSHNGFGWRDCYRRAANSANRGGWGLLTWRWRCRGGRRHAPSGPPTGSFRDIETSA